MGDEQAGSRYLAALEAEARAWVALGLARQRRVITSPTGPHSSLAGQGSVLAFLSNDYLGLAAEPALAAAVAEGAARWGAGAGASALISGHLECHALAERALSQFVGFDAALLFITGYMANLAVIPSLVAGTEDVVFSDQLNHASLIDGCRLSRARIVRYPHRDLGALAELLADTPARRRLVVSDAVFSMDGDCADLAGLLSLAERHDALLLVDDAHGFGVRGPQGRGSLAEAELSSPRLILMATLGKAAGLSGAFVAASALLVEHFMQHGRTYIYSTAPAPALAYAVPEALRLVEAGDGRRWQLARLRAAVVTVAAHWRFPLGLGDTPILPVQVGAAEDTMRLVERFAEQGVLMAGIRPPTVPAGTSRLRISLSAAHTLEDVAVLGRAARAAGLEA